MFDFINKKLHEINVFRQKISCGFVYQVSADVYDGETKVNDTLIFVSLNDETDIVNVCKIIDDLLTPEIYKYRKKSLIRYVLDNKIIKKIIDKIRGK